MVFFEAMNEPEVDDAYRWMGIQARAVAAIRAVAPHNTIIVAGNRYSDIYNLLAFESVADPNVIYTFHFYDPHEFTHQGAGWGEPWWRFVHDVPYPADRASIDPILAQAPDDQSRLSMLQYALDHWDAAHIRGLIDAAAAWAKNRNVPLICNEFGAYREYSRPDDRMRWIHDVRVAFEADGIGWTMWDYRGGFGVVDKSSGTAVPDARVVEALGLKPIS